MPLPFAALAALGGLGAFPVGYGLGKAGKSIYNKNKSFFAGNQAGVEQVPMFNEEQQQALSQLLQQGLQNTDFQGIEELEKKRFQEDTIPSLAERFSGMGGQRSSAFQSSIGRAGSDLGTRLGALRSNFGLQQLGMGLQPQTRMFERPGEPGIGQNILQMLPILLSMI